MMKGHMTPEDEIVMVFRRNKGFIQKTMRDCGVARPRLYRILRERGLQ